MKKKVFGILLASVMALGMISTAFAAETAEDGSIVDLDALETAEVVLTWCDSQPATSLLGQKILRFGEIIEEETNGRIILQYYPSAMRGNGVTCMQQVQIGDLDIYRCDSGAVYDFGVESEKVISLPYLFKDQQSAIDVVEDGEVGHQLLQDITDAGVGFVGIGWFIDTPRRFFGTKEVHTLEDLKGIKIRSVEVQTTLDYKQALGMNPVPLAFSEVYTSLSTGVIDAAANTLDSYVTNKMNEVAPYFIENNGMIPAYPVVMSAVTWGKLSEEDQQLVVDCLLKATHEYDEECVANEEAEKEEMLAAGVTFCEIEDEDRWAEACEEMIQAGAEGQEELLEALRTWGK